jgi:hypothetical protein
MRVSELNALPWEEVRSTNIARLAYQRFEAEPGVGYPPGEAPGGELFVHFFADGEQSVYRYFDVPEQVYQTLVHARSVGSMHAKIVKGKFRYERVNVEPDPMLGDDGEDEPDPIVIALTIFSERLQALESEVANMSRLIAARLRPTRPQPKEQHDRDKPARPDPERAGRPVEHRGT